MCVHGVDLNFTCVLCEQSLKVRWEAALEMLRKVSRLGPKKAGEGPRPQVVLEPDRK